ncbi:MAG: response regulator transcription factor [Bryobacteraceae bacterium]|jgi:Response regulator of the LytR/AlgR family|nr:response regulator transcription factor [Bryobacteraceae bacterium]
METIRALIVDDEALARTRIRRLLLLERDFEIAGECVTGAEALAWLNENSADIVFLDIQMPEMGGFELLERLAPERIPVVIFVTAYDEYALRAFEVHAFDYLLKPFDRQRFQKTIQRTRARLKEMRQGSIDQRLMSLLADFQSRRADKERIAIKNGGRVLFVRMDEIDWVEAADNYVCLHVGEETHLLRETMNALESRLDPTRFLRIHRSTIVNVDRIKELQPWFRGDYVVVLRSGVKLNMSRSYREKLKPLLG